MFAVLVVGRETCCDEKTEPCKDEQSIQTTDENIPGWAEKTGRPSRWLFFKVYSLFPSPFSVYIKYILQQTCNQMVQAMHSFGNATLSFFISCMNGAMQWSSGHCSCIESHVLGVSPEGKCPSKGYEPGNSGGSWQKY